MTNSVFTNAPFTYWSGLALGQQPDPTHRYKFRSMPWLKPVVMVDQTRPANTIRGRNNGPGSARVAPQIEVVVQLVSSI